MPIGNLLNDFRKWLDGEEAATFKSEEQPKPRRALEEFLVSIAREIEAAMQREMFTPPGGPTYIPREYLVFLSREDDGEWQGDKREGLQRGLHHVLSERAQELIGKHELQTKTFAVELRVDGTLEKSKFRVQPVWDSATPKTEVKPRRQPEPIVAQDKPDSSSLATVLDNESEATVVRPRHALFAIEYTIHDTTETVKFFQPTITIGRGSKDFPVDLRLKDDLEISRKQATLARDAAGQFTLTCEGRNPIEVDGQELMQGDRVAIVPGQSFKVGAYELKISA
jgi:hypothetical protein